MTSVHTYQSQMHQGLCVQNEQTRTHVSSASIHVKQLRSSAGRPSYIVEVGYREKPMT